jgi:hypothetical protein
MPDVSAYLIKREQQNPRGILNGLYDRKYASKIVISCDRVLDM